MNFNSNFYEPNFKYTKEDAEKRLLDLGYDNFQFKGMSYTNGCSFYFTTSKGEEIRVSDHQLTGKRAFEVIQVRIEEVKTIGIIRKKESSNDLKDRIALAIAKNN